MKKGCGQQKCKVSTGICESVTFGWGELDPNGYWEFPCEACAIEWKKTYIYDDVITNLKGVGDVCLKDNLEDEGLLYDDDAG